MRQISTIVDNRLALAHIEANVEKVIKVREVASRTGFSAHVVRRAIHDGIVRGVQLGGKGSAIWVPEGEVDKLNALLKGDQ